jgi:pimeloyl-ACP methyl ester carboxylesterase
VELTAGYRTAVRDEGEGPPLVLLHGTPLDLRCWDQVVRALGAQRRVVRYDLRGHGSASKVALPASFEPLVADLEVLLDRLEIERAHVAGHSFGGQLAQAFALERGERVERLSVICARATPFAPFAAAAEHVRREGPAVTIETALVRWFGEGAARDGEGPAAYARECMLAISAEDYATALELIAGFDALDRLGSLGMDVSLIAAEHDEVSSVAELERSLAALAHGRLTIVPDGRHMLPLQVPERLAELLAA